MEIGGRETRIDGKLTSVKTMNQRLVAVKN